MARWAADLSLQLDVIAGPDPLEDGIGYTLALPPPRHGHLKDFRVLLVDSDPVLPTDNSVRAALDGLAGELAKQGATVLRRHQDMPDLARTTRVYVELLAAMFAADLPAEELRLAEQRAAAAPPDDISLASTWVRGVTMTHAAWVRASGARQGLRARWQTLFRNIDVLLCPPMPTVAFPHDHHTQQFGRSLDVDGQKELYDNQVIWAAVATLVGLPATVAPIAHKGDLPVGVQIIGGYLDDRTTIGFAGLLEHALGGFVPPPNLS